MGHQHKQASSAPATSVTRDAAREAVVGNPVYDAQQTRGNASAMDYLNELTAGERDLWGGDTAYGAEPEYDNIYSYALQQADRAMAQQELAGRFEIVADDHTGPRLPNQVSQGEFERITTMYSDIRSDRTNIQFAKEGSAADQTAFRGAAMGDIATLLTTGQGRDLLDELAYGQVDGRDETVTLGGVANPALGEMDRAPGEGRADAFNGTGVSTHINYAPGQTADMATMDPRYETADYRHTSSDTLLFHELTHAYHYRQGNVAAHFEHGDARFDPIGDSQATIPNDRGASFEEYQTVGLAGRSPYTENAYRAERARVTGKAIPRRGNYAGPGARQPQ